MRYTAHDRHAAIRFSWLPILLAAIVVMLSFAASQLVLNQSAHAVDTDVHANIQESTSTENLELQVVSIDESELQTTGEYTLTVRVRGVMMVRLLYNARLIETRSISGPFDEWQSITFRMRFSGAPEIYQLSVVASNNSQVQAQVAVTAEYEPETPPDTTLEPTPANEPVSTTNPDRSQGQVRTDGRIGMIPPREGDDVPIANWDATSESDKAPPTGNITMLPPKTVGVRVGDMVIPEWIITLILASVIAAIIVWATRRFLKTHQKL